MGNLFFFLGLFPVIGLAETLLFFQRKIKGSICFFVGLVFIITNVTFIGILFQIFGIYEFFKNIFPKILPIIYEIPYSRDVIEYIQQIINAIKLHFNLNDNKKKQENIKDLNV